MAQAGAFGLDFGTTNSAVARVGPDGTPQLVHFEGPAGAAPTFRSVLFFEDEAEREGAAPRVRAGPDAIAAHLEGGSGAGRLVQSMKSFLASRLFSGTTIGGRLWRLEDLVAELLRALRERAERELDVRVEHAVVGRPVRFVGANDPEDEALALARLGAALRNAGFREVDFELEPVGAAYHYEQQLDDDALILIADFGGGTSDFSLLRVGPSYRAGADRSRAVLGNDGVGLAGDAFDGKLVRHLVAPRLGRGSEVRSVFGRVLPVPAWIYSHLERWHHVSFLRSPRTMRTLLDLRREALEPGKLDALLHVVEADLGFQLYEAVESTKRALSEREAATLSLHHGALEIEAAVTREEFETWIADELAAIGTCVDRLLGRAGLAPRAVDRVFLTGGSSFVPAVRRVFADRFGAERLRSGAELTSVAGGLALRALEGVSAGSGRAAQPAAASGPGRGPGG